MPISKYFIVSFFGMLPGVFLYVNAGSQISKISSLKDIYDINIIISFLILGLFPLIAKKVVNYFKLIKRK